VLSQVRDIRPKFPQDYRDPYEEEWQAEFDALPRGKLTKLLFGLRIYAGARATGAVCQAEDNMDLAAGAAPSGHRLAGPDP
jgi:hypothetical protein